MKTTVKAALEMLQAIGQLDSYQNGADKPTLYRYSGDTRLRIAIARRKLRVIQDDYQEARNKMLVEVTDGAGELPLISNIMPPEERRRVIGQHLKFNERDKELLMAEIELDIEPLPSSSFNLDENPIPPSVLDLLGDLIGR